MNDKPNIETLIDRYLTGKSSPEDNEALSVALKDNTDLVSAVYEQSLIDHDLKKLFHHEKARVSRSASLRPLFFRVLAAAAAILLAAGVGFLYFTQFAPDPVITVAALHGNAEAFVVRENRTVVAGIGDRLHTGDQIRLQGTGSATLQSVTGGVKLDLTNRGRLKILSKRRYLLEEGRIKVACLSREGNDPLQFMTSLSRVDVTGTEFVLKTLPLHSAVRTEKGHIRFYDLRSEDSVTVGAGECAMIHKDKEDIYKDTYSPGKYIEGRIIFSDDFEDGVEQWKSLVVDKHRNISELPSDMKNPVSWGSVKRDGRETGCMKILGTQKLPEGDLFVVPQSLDYSGQFIAEMDFSIITKSFANMSFLTRFFDSPLEGEHNYINPGAVQIDDFYKRWGDVSIVHMDANKENGIHVESTMVSIDKELLYKIRMTDNKPLLLGVRLTKGRVLIDNFVVKELISFD